MDVHFKWHACLCSLIRSDTFPLFVQVKMFTQLLLHASYFCLFFELIKQLFENSGLVLRIITYLKIILTLPPRRLY
jgi:hypothetical protein